MNYQLLIPSICVQQKSFFDICPKYNLEGTLYFIFKSYYKILFLIEIKTKEI